MISHKECDDHCRRSWYSLYAVDKGRGLILLWFCYKVSTLLKYLICQLLQKGINNFDFKIFNIICLLKIIRQIASCHIKDSSHFSLFYYLSLVLGCWCSTQKKPRQYFGWMRGYVWVNMKVWNFVVFAYWACLIVRREILISKILATGFDGYRWIFYFGLLNFALELLLNWCACNMLVLLLNWHLNFSKLKIFIHLSDHNEWSLKFLDNFKNFLIFCNVAGP